VRRSRHHVFVVFPYGRGFTSSKYLTVECVAIIQTYGLCSLIPLIMHVSYIPVGLGDRGHLLQF
jgi:hypothetical protein